MGGGGGGGRTGVLKSRSSDIYIIPSFLIINAQSTTKVMHG